MPDMTLTSFVVAAAPRTGKVIKNGSVFFERDENMLQNGILHLKKSRTPSFEKK